VGGAALLLGLMVACGNGAGGAPAQTGSSTSATTSTSTTASTSESARTSATTNETLALAPVAGDSVVDREIASAQESARANPAKEDLWIALGRAWVKKARKSSDPGFYLNANACADIALDIKKDSKVANDLKGLVLLNDHKFEQARALAANVVAKHPDDPMAYGNLSDALMEMGRYDEAFAATQQMIDLKPNLPSYSRASYAQWLHGDARAAKESVRLAIDSGNDGRDREPRAWVLVQAAMLFWHAGDYDGAEAGFDQALAWNPEFPPALVGEGRVAMATGDAKTAVSALDRAFAQSPLVETAWLLGDAKTMAGDDAGAQKAYAFVENEGKKSDPRTLSAFLSAKNEKPELALSLAQKEHEVRQDVYTDDALAWALYRNGRVQEAKDAIVRARRLGTNDAKLVYHEGAIRIANGETAEGLALVRKALATCPKFDVAGAGEAQNVVNKIAAQGVGKSGPHT
jgi:tetratricopeptide (TPR) repeat protein